MRMLIGAVLLLCMPLAHPANVVCLLKFQALPPHYSAEARKAYGNPSSKDVCEKIALVGEILPGDLKKVTDSFVRSEGYLNSLALSSPGGDMREAMMIGRFVRTALLHTEAPNWRGSPDARPYFSPRFDLAIDPCSNADCVCASACFLVWAAGNWRTGNYLAIHRPRFDTKYFGSLGQIEAEAKYRETLISMREYLKEMDVPDNYYDLMVRTPSTEVEVLNADDVLLTLQIWSNDRPAFDEWVTAQCGRISETEANALFEYHIKTLHKFEFGDWINIPDPAYYALAEKKIRIQECRGLAAFNARMKLYREFAGSGLK